MKMYRSAMRAARTSFGVLVPALFIAGCEVGPDYQKPDMPVPDTFRSAEMTPAASQSIADLPWWSVFNDKVLQNLIGTALHNNYDLQVAVARIEQARALVGVAESEGLPQIGYGASASGQRAVAALPGGTTQKAPTFGILEGMLNVAWEMDIWGRIQRSTEAARANLLAQEDVRHAVMLTLVSDIAAGYFQLLELDRELAIARESSQVYKKTVDLFNSRFEAGRDSKLPVERARAAYESSNALAEELKRRIGLQENAISTLVGDYPQAIPRGRPLQDQVTPHTPVGATTELLRRRPDILEAEQNMIAANAQIGVAVANFFPRIGLSSFVGGQGFLVGGNTAGFGVWSAALSATGPIFSGGRLEEEYNQSKAFWDETVAQYKQKVLVAFRETSDALVSQQTLAGQRAALEGQVAALRSSADLAMKRYGAGRASYFEVLEADNQLFPAEQSLAQTERDQLDTVVNLYKALGGGWDNAGAAPATVPAAASAEGVAPRAASALTQPAAQSATATQTSAEIERPEH